MFVFIKGEFTYIQRINISMTSFLSCIHYIHICVCIYIYNIYSIILSVQMKDQLFVFFSLGLRGKKLQEVGSSYLKDLDKGKYMN